MAKAYHIVQWNQLYEKSDTRKTPYMSWYSKQTKLTGIGIGMTLQQPAPRNLVLLGTWALIETLASLSAFEHRGWLVRNGLPMSVEDMSALIPTVPAAAFQDALDWFSQPRINWLEQVDFVPAGSGVRERGGKSPGDSPDKSPAGSGVRERTGRNSATDRETDSTQRDRETLEREREGASREANSAVCGGGEPDPGAGAEGGSRGIDRGGGGRIKKNARGAQANFKKTGEGRF